MRRQQLHVLVLKLVPHCLNVGCLCLHLTTGLLHHLTVALMGRHVLTMLTNINTGEKNPLGEQCFLETKTREEGQTGPLFSVTASYVCQTELQMKCVGHEGKLLFFNLLCQSLRNQSTFLAGPFHYVSRSLGKYKLAEKEATGCYIVIIKLPLPIFLITVMMFAKIYIMLSKNIFLLLF